MPQLNVYTGGSTWKAPFYKAVDAASNSVYHVFTAEGLQAWASAAASSPSTGCVLHNSIDMTGEEWSPVGSSSSQFKGTFDGGGNTIFNLSVSKSASSGDVCVGLFGYLGSAAVVSNLTITGGTFTATSSGSGHACAGAVAAESYGKVINCHNVSSAVKATASSSTEHPGGVIGIVRGGAVTGCTNSGSVTSSGATSGTVYAGGIASYSASAHISLCTNSGTVTGSGTYTGGIAGYSSGAVSSCTNSGAVTGSGTYTGGIAGYSTGAVSSCTNSGTVTGSGTYTGGIAGASSGAVSSCTNSGTVTGTMSAVGNPSTGGIAGYSTGAVSSCTNSGTVTGTGYSTTTANAVHVNTGGIAGDSSGAVSSCTNSGTATSKTGYCLRAGGIAGVLQSGGVLVFCTNKGTASSSNAGTYSRVGGIVGDLNTLTNSLAYYANIGSPSTTTGN